MIPDILLLGGAPGTGKSTIARLLSDRAAVIEVDDLRGELWHVQAAATLTPREMHHVALAQAATMASAFLARGESQVIVVDTFGAEAFHSFVRAIRGRAGYLSISLVVDFGEHARRLRERPEVHGVFRDLIAARRVDAELQRATTTLRIDTTHLVPAQIVAMVSSAMRGNSPRTSSATNEGER